LFERFCMYRGRFCIYRVTRWWNLILCFTVWYCKYRSVLICNSLRSKVDINSVLLFSNSFCTCWQKEVTTRDTNATFPGHLAFAQILKSICLYWTRTIITVFTKASHWLLFWVSSVLFTDFWTQNKMKINHRLKIKSIQTQLRSFIYRTKCLDRLGRSGS
jgi:hypothetical protein